MRRRTHLSSELSSDDFRIHVHVDWVDPTYGPFGGGDIYPTVRAARQGVLAARGLPGAVVTASVFRPGQTTPSHTVTWA